MKLKKEMKLKYKGKVILPKVRVMTSVWRISLGLMFASKKTVDKGACLVMPSNLDVRHGAAVTMFFCFMTYDILFVNSKLEVVDRVNLKPWKMSYVPKESAKYVFESTKDKFKNIKIGDKIELV